MSISFPKQVAYQAILVYLCALVSISFYYFGYAMKFGYMVLGITSVVGFFLVTQSCTRTWSKWTEKRFLRDLFIMAFCLRLVWVVASYFYYIRATGQPFEFDTADALGYHEEAKWLASEGWASMMDYYFGSGFKGFADIGYPLYLSAVYSIFGPIVILPRIIKAVLSAYTCVLVYRLSSRTFGEDVARMVAIMTALMPNLIIYCGYHLKETEMLFLEVAFLERMDYLMRSHKATPLRLLLPISILIVLFLFRTVLGAAAAFAYLTSVLVSSAPAMRKGWKRAALIGWGVICVVFFAGGRIVTEVESYWEGRAENVENKRYDQTLQGNRWAQYATGAVMAPMVVVLPFSTMVDVDQQYAQQTKHGGNFIRNFMGFFVFLAIYEAFRRKQWRDFALIGAFVIAYLGVVAFSGFSNSERFLLPGLPCLIMMWAYGVSVLRKPTYKMLPYWCIVVFMMEFAWAFFKLGSRGLF